MQEDIGIISLDLADNIPDLNPIENMWDQMTAKKRIRKPITMTELKEAIEKVWYVENAAEYLSASYSSKPKRVKNVIKAKDDTTNF